MNEIARTLIARCDALKVLSDESMAKHTTFRIGGPADALALPASTEEVRLTIDLAREIRAPWMVIGNGSNLLVRDGGIRGIVIATTAMNKISVREDEITAQAGALLPKVSMAALKSGLAGLEFAAGIPGSIGGAVAMNAGAYGGQMSDVVTSAEVLTATGVTEVRAEEMDFGYRKSWLTASEDVLLSVRMALKTGDMAEIRDVMDDFTARRKEKQPLEWFSAGSTFKRPEGYFAGALIEGAGLKGYSVGGARVSEKHAGFVVNDGTATADDVLTVIAHVQKTVLDVFGVKMETEVKIVGEDK